MPKIVAHPETGQPVVEEVSYQGVELSQLQADVDTAAAAVSATDAELNTARDQITSLEQAKVDQEAALGEAKSNLEAYQAIAPDTGTDVGTAGSGSDVEATPEDESTEPASADGSAEGTEQPEADPTAETVGDTPVPDAAVADTTDTAEAVQVNVTPSEPPV